MGLGRPCDNTHMAPKAFFPTQIPTSAYKRPNAQTPAEALLNLKFAGGNTKIYEKYSFKEVSSHNRFGARRRSCRMAVLSVRRL